MYLENKIDNNKPINNYSIMRYQYLAQEVLTEENREVLSAGNQLIQHLICDRLDLIILHLMYQPVQHLVLHQQVTWTTTHMTQIYTVFQEYGVKVYVTGEIKKSTLIWFERLVQMEMTKEQLKKCTIVMRKGTEGKGGQKWDEKIKLRNTLKRKSWKEGGGDVEQELRGT